MVKKHALVKYLTKFEDISVIFYLKETQRVEFCLYRHACSLHVSSKSAEKSGRRPEWVDREGKKGG